MQKKLMTAALLIFVGSGCQWYRARTTEEYKTLGKAPGRDTQAARRHNAKAVRLLKNDQLAQAERELKAGLAADMFFGPAHNNLGTVYFRQKKLYLAAWEFQYAAKLMPNKAEPRNNLGMVFEAVGKLDEAAKWYDEALELEPDSVQITGNLARVYVRTNRKDDKTRRLLTKLVMKDRRPDWLSWAKERLALMGRPESPPATTQPGVK